MTCRAAEAGAPYILTAVCCFSRWPWLIPIQDKTAVTIAEGLVTKVFLPMVAFPVAIRSGNAFEFTAQVMQEVTRLLGVN